MFILSSNAEPRQLLHWRHVPFCGRAHAHHALRQSVCEPIDLPVLSQIKSSCPILRLSSYASVQCQQCRRRRHASGGSGMFSPEPGGFQSPPRNRPVRGGFAAPSSLNDTANSTAPSAPAVLRRRTRVIPGFGESAAVRGSAMDSHSHATPAGPAASSMRRSAPCGSSVSRTSLPPLAIALAGVFIFHVTTVPGRSPRTQSSTLRPSASRVNFRTTFFASG